MKIAKRDLFIQVKYSDLAEDRKGLDEYFLGFGGEVYLSPDEIAGFDSRLVGNVKSFTAKNRLPLRLHAPITEIDYSRLKGAIPRIRALYEKVIDFCKILNIHSVVAHAEFDYNAALPIDEQLEGAVLLWGDLLKGLERSDVSLIMENHCETKPDHLLVLAERINSPYFGMCVDIGHLNAFSGLDMDAWIKKYPAGSIKEAHLADNKGDGDTHLPLGNGNIDFARFFEVLKRRGEDCVFVLEPQNLEEARMSLAFMEKAGLIG
jgi:sugar phosphate isomerase/epimerase